MSDPSNNLARLLEYPADDYSGLVERAVEAVMFTETEAAHYLGAFANAIQDRSTEQLQELFIQTFDLNPVCVLEVGWQLFGDDYKRGEFLVRMREELRDHELPESCELPDHLTRVLPLLAQMDPEDAAPFASYFVLPAVEKMLAGLKDKQNPFETLLLAIRARLRSYPVAAGQEATHA